MAKEKIDKRRPCANCGDLTHFGNAIGAREKLGWCGACWRVREKNCRQDSGGGEVWLEPRGLHDSGRGLREREQS